ncbi:MAG: rod shape-determining protein MreC [Candidatus Saccharibacteria bacterium]
MRKNSRARLAAIITVVVVTVILAFQLLGLWRPFQIVIDGITRPISGALSGMTRGIGSGISTLGSLATLSKENARLSQALSEKESQLAERKEVEQENELLRQQLNFSKNQPFQLIGASVVGYSPDNVRRSLTIDRGSNDGITAGQAVMSSGVMVGKVDKVNDRSAIVYLVNDPEFRVQGLSQSGRARGIVRGQLGSGLHFENIAQSETLEKGEYVLSAGSELVPKGILIGAIESIDRSDNEIFQAANLRPLVDYRRLETVFVVKN